MKSLVILSLIGLVVLGSAVNAEEGEGKKAKKSPEEKFAKMDKNQDGMVSLEEFSARAMKKAEKKGKKDGNAEEAVAAAKEKADMKFSKKDKNGDGSISLEEFSTKGKGKAKKEKKPKVDIENNGEDMGEDDGDDMEDDN